MRIAFTSCALLLYCLQPAIAADLSVGSAVAAPGHKATGFIEVPARSDAATSIPVIVVNGAQPGPSLALIAGSHGTEYASILALQQLAESVDAALLSGSLIIVPLINVNAFQQKVPHLNPTDGKNMNRFFPGSEIGTQTDRVSWAIAHQIVQKCDYLIDLHGGDLDENLRRYSYLATTGNAEQDDMSRRMVLAFGLDHIILQDFRKPAANGATPLTRYSASLGKPSVTAEAGHAGVSEKEDVESLIHGCTSVMRLLKMLPGDAVPVEHPLWIGSITVLASDADGVFYPLTQPEAYVAKGMRIGYVTDYFGRKIWDAVAPVSGVIVYVGALPSMKKGGTVAYIGELAEAGR